MSPEDQNLRSAGGGRSWWSDLVGSLFSRLRFREEPPLPLSTDITLVGGWLLGTGNAAPCSVHRLCESLKNIGMQTSSKLESPPSSPLSQDLERLCAHYIAVTEDLLRIISTLYVQRPPKNATEETIPYLHRITPFIQVAGVCVLQKMQRLDYLRLAIDSIGEAQPLFKAIQAYDHAVFRSNFIEYSALFNRASGGLYVAAAYDAYLSDIDQIENFIGEYTEEMQEMGDYPIEVALDRCVVLHSFLEGQKEKIRKIAWND